MNPFLCMIGLHKWIWWGEEKDLPRILYEPFYDGWGGKQIWLGNGREIRMREVRWRYCIKCKRRERSERI